MSNYDELELQAFIDAVDRAVDKGEKISGPDVHDVLDEASYFLEVLGEDTVALSLRDLAGYAEDLKNDSEQIDTLKERLEKFLEMIGEPSWDPLGSELEDWLSAHGATELVLIPESLSRKEAEAALQEKSEE